MNTTGNELVIEIPDEESIEDSSNEITNEITDRNTGEIFDGIPNSTINHNETEA